MKILSYSLIFSLLLVACSSGNTGKTPAQKAREQAIEALTDSMKIIEADKAQAIATIGEMQQVIDNLTDQFTIVDNPRLVEPYTIQKSLAASYPLQTTGLTARITKAGNMELVAALSGDTFNAISVSSEKGSVESDVVPHDQGLNYQSGALTTVAFSGHKADSIGSLINNSANNCTVTFLQNGTKTGSFTLGGATKTAIAHTWQLYDARRRLALAEHSIPLLSKKAQAYTIRLEELKNDAASTPDR